MRDSLLNMLAAKVKRGDFTLASGAKSNFYLDAREVTMSNKGARYAGALFYEIARQHEATAIAGPATAAVPIIVAAMMCSPDRESDKLEGGYIRLQEKGHGTRKCVEGSISEGARVILVDDVATSGGSLIKSARALIHERPDVKIVGIHVLVDRGERNRQPFAVYGPGPSANEFDHVKASDGIPVQHFALGRVFHIDEILGRG